MTGGLRPYPEYKDSGVSWLGGIPKHWSVRRNGGLFSQRNETSRPELPILEVSLRTGVRVRELEAGVRKQVLAERTGYKRAAKGDMAYNIMRMWQGAVGVAPTDGLVSPAYIVATPHEGVDSRYFAYVFRTDAYMNEVNSYSRGIVADRNRLYWDDFKQMPAVVPPPDEQRTIADYLDIHGRWNRRLIDTKQRLIELLNEQKQVIITQAVTRGLDPNVRLKPSGINWLGDVPAHWDATRLKYIAEIQTGITLGKNYGASPLEERPYLRVANVQDGHLDLRRITTVRVPMSEAIASELQARDVLMTEGGDIDKLGRGYLWEGDIPGCLHQNHVFAVRTDSTKLLPEYLVALMTSRHGRSYFQLTAKQTTNLASTNGTTLRAFPLFLPDIEEQKELLDHIAGETSGLDKAEDRSQRELQLLREYQTRLIADVVTGKLDVRDVKLPTPDEAGMREDVTADDDEGPEADEASEPEETPDAGD